MMQKTATALAFLAIVGNLATNCEATTSCESSACDALKTNILDCNVEQLAQKIYKKHEQDDMQLAEFRKSLDGQRWTNVDDYIKENEKYLMSCWGVGSRVRIVPGSRFADESSACGTVSTRTCAVYQAANPDGDGMGDGMEDGMEEITFDDGYSNNYAYEDFEACDDGGLFQKKEADEAAAKKEADEAAAKKEADVNEVPFLV
jgi:hypothetical protein